MLLSSTEITDISASKYYIFVITSAISAQFLLKNFSVNFHKISQVFFF